MGSLKIDVTNSMKRGYAMKQIVNPYLPLNEYIPDGEPHVFGNRVYVFGSHDKENGEAFCLLDYVAYSAPVDDLTQWTYEGVIYKKEQDPANVEGKMMLYAPDVCQGPDGRFYLYYCLNGLSKISVAVSDRPSGTYEFLGYVAYPSGQFLEENFPFDPAVLHDDGKVYVYYGFSPTNINIPGFPSRDKILGCSFIELEQDMLTVKQGPKIVLPSEAYSQGTGFEGHEYFEAPSIRKIDSMFYLIYSSVLSHELCYAISAYPDKGFVYQGTIVSNGDIGYKGRMEEDKVAIVGNNHGGIECINNQWYVFYHRHTHGHQFSRQGCAEPIVIDEEGKIEQVEITSCGLNGKPLNPKGRYSAAICSTLSHGKMLNLLRQRPTWDYPYITHEDERHYITNITKDTTVGFKYFDFSGKTRCSVSYRGTGEGRIQLFSDAFIPIQAKDEWTVSLSVEFVLHGEHPLYLRYEGSGSIEIEAILFDEISSAF